MPTRRFAARFSALATAAVLVAGVGVARAQDQEPVGVPGLRIVSGQSSVVGGNAAGARDRALDEAFRQAVDQALAELLDAPTRATQAKAIRALEGRARSYVRRYRALEESETGGAYVVKLEAEVDEPALRRAAERWGAPAGPVAAPVAPGFLVVGSGAADGAPPLVQALVNAGVRAQAAPADATAPAAAQQAATRASLAQVAFVAADATPEGAVRGTAQVAVACHLRARVVAAATGLTGAEPVVEARAFAQDDATARAQCLARAAAELAARLAPTGAAAPAPGADLRIVTVEADVVEPGAVVALIKAARSIGAVSSAELRRVTPGRAELRLRTRGTAAALAPALSRDASGGLDLTNVEVVGDRIRLRARVRTPSTAASP